jgi:hypothetical protein
MATVQQHLISHLITTVNNYDACSEHIWIFSCSAFCNGWHAVQIKSYQTLVNSCSAEKHLPPLMKSLMNQKLVHHPAKDAQVFQNVLDFFMTFGIDYGL